MSAYLVLFVAVLSRLFPSALHGVGLNLTAVGGSLLFFGARRPRREFLVAAAVLALTDWYLTVSVFRYPFHVADYAVTWLWYLAVPLLGQWLLARGGEPRRASVGMLRGAAAVLGSATSFFAVSNFVVWTHGGLYPRTGAGLMGCYTAALPFYGNDLVSTGITAGVLFGLPALARELHHAVAGHAEPPVAR